MFTQFEEGTKLSETRNDAEKGDETYDDSIMSPILSEEEMNAMDSSDESDHNPISTEMLEDIRYGSQSHPNVNRREARYKKRHCIKQKNWNGKEL